MGTNCQTLQTALKTTCRLYDANSLLPNISLPDQTAQQVLEIMSTKSVQDACIWVNESLPSGFPSESGVDCSDVSSLGGLCSQWSEYTSILRIEEKVQRLNPSVNEDSWFTKHPDLNRDNYSNSDC
jgi:hypothetical protein